MNIQNSKNDTGQEDTRTIQLVVYLINHISLFDHADAKAIQQMDFTGNLNRTGKTAPLLTLEES